MSSELSTDFIVRKRQPYFSAIHVLNDNAQLPNNIYGKPIKCYTCGCSFHVNKDCIKYNKKLKDFCDSNN